HRDLRRPDVAPLLALLTMITVVHPANLIGTWHGKSGTLTITNKMLRHSSNTYPAAWSADGKQLTIKWDVGIHAVFLPQFDCPYTLNGRTLKLERACWGIEGVYARQ